MLQNLGGPGTLILIGAIISAFGAFLAYRDSLHSETVLREKSEEIIKLNQTMNDYISGGDSFCYVDIAIDLRTKMATIAVNHQGKYPLYDLTVRITDASKVKENMERYQKAPSMVALATLFQQDLNINIGTLNPKRSYISVIQWPLSISDERTFNIFFSARNGSFTQKYRQKVVQGHALQATQVIREDDGKTKVLYENVEKNFPIDKAGNVIWD